MGAQDTDLVLRVKMLGKGHHKKVCLGTSSWKIDYNLPILHFSPKTYFLNLHSVHVLHWLLAVNFTSKQAHICKHTVWGKRLLYMIICIMQLCNHVWSVVCSKFLDYARSSDLFHSFVVKFPRRTTMFWLHLQSVWVLIDVPRVCWSRRSHVAIFSHAAMGKDLRSAV